MGNTLLWPALPLEEWQETYRALHLRTQIIGKIRMALFPPLNHWWHVALYVNSRGLTTGPIPYALGMFEIQLDFEKHAVHIRTCAGTETFYSLKAESIASFYAGVLNEMASLGIEVKINPKPQEIAGAIPFDQDVAVRPYDAEYVDRCWHILMSTAAVMEKFRGRFIGKCSPVHFFWGSFDLACSRFSGRLAPPRKGLISGPAYSHEVCSVGFWPGGGGFGPTFYSYTVPRPAALQDATVRPAGAKWDTQLSEFILPYDDVRNAASPEQALLEFFESTYDAGADLAKWDRAALDHY